MPPLKESMKQKFLITERKILRKILGPVREGHGTWRIKTNYELNDLVKKKAKVKFALEEAMKT